MGICKMNQSMLANKTCISCNYLAQYDIEELIINDQYYKYEKIFEVPQKKMCFAIAFNKYNTMAAACGEQINIYKFNEGLFQLLQVLKQHTCEVTVLIFLNSNLISGDMMGEITYWQFKEVCNYLYDFTPPHDQNINCIVSNREENLIITADDVTIIKIWKQNEKWECCQTIKFHNFTVYQISLNSQSNQFLVCGSRTQFQIFYFDKKWKKLQRIQGEGKDFFRACFITDTMIVNQPYLLNQMQVFQFSEQNKLFQKHKDIQIHGGKECYIYFPMQFIQKKQIIVNKNGYSINIIQKLKNNELELRQVIPIESAGCFGTMTNNGDYLVVWDFHSFSFKIWKYCQQINNQMY